MPVDLSPYQNKYVAFSTNNGNSCFGVIGMMDAEGITLIKDAYVGKGTIDELLPGYLKMHGDRKSGLSANFKSFEFNRDIVEEDSIREIADQIWNIQATVENSASNKTGREMLNNIEELLRKAKKYPYG